eukprot:gene12749-15998_t
MSAYPSEDALELMADTMEQVFPVCDGVGHTFPGGACLENGDSNRGYVYYSDFRRCSGSWVLLPGFNLLPRWLQAIAYFLWLTWLFFGVAVISDLFVEAIEEITSATKTVKRTTASGKVVDVEVPVWNWVVSNITLMALGSSSPEILLAVVETLISLNRTTEELGPSTIIGSGSFNLFAITAICTISLKPGQFKRIDHQKVFVWTTTWMLWAHLWLWLVYKKISPGEIEIWEAVVTLAFMPFFVFTSYLVDIRGWAWFSPRNMIWPDDVETDGDGAPHKPTGLTMEQRHSILYYRQLAVQQMKGNTVHMSEADHAIEMTPVVSHSTAEVDFSKVKSGDKTVQKVMFKSPHYSCLESAGMARVQVMRIHGDRSQTLSVSYKTEDSSAIDGLDYLAQEGTLEFAPHEEMKEIAIKIVDDDMSEPDVSFFVCLTSAEIGAKGELATILQPKVVVTIVDDDDGGILSFELPSVEAGMSADSAEVTVVRRNGADGQVTVNYSTKEGSALSGTHFTETTGTLTFKPQEIQKVISIPLLPQPELDAMASLMNFNHKAFKVALSEPGGGAQIGTRSECRVILVPGGQMPKSFDDGGRKTKDATVVKGGSDGGDGASDTDDFDFWGAWRCQFKDAIMPEFEDGDDLGTFFTCLLHYINITWKVVAACIPPPSYKGGYVAFFVSLGLLGGLMTVVKEVGGLFGCSVGLSEIMTGMSLIALGTSLRMPSLT